MPLFPMDPLSLVFALRSFFTWIALSSILAVVFDLVSLLFDVLEPILPSEVTDSFVFVEDTLTSSTAQALFRVVAWTIDHFVNFQLVDATMGFMVLIWFLAFMFKMVLWVIRKIPFIAVR